MSYTTKTDCWGRTCYYDERGRLIGKESTTLGGKRIIKDANGTVIGRPQKDDYDRETIILEKKSSFFNPPKTTTLLRQGELEDHEICESCGEYLDGDDDMYCEDCLHDHF